MTKSEPINLLHTPLFDLIPSQGKLTAFAGWEMPIQYSGLKQEHQAVRNGVGMFDISHMGKFSLRGKQLITILQKLVPTDLARLQPSQAQYTVLLNDQAGIIDDIIFYYQGKNDQDEHLGMMIVNAATTAKDIAWLRPHLATIELEDLSQQQVLIALQGRQALSKLQPLVKQDLASLKPFDHLEATILNHPCFIARTGYTGEDGFEIMLNPELGRQLWQLLLDAGVAPCGLGARDTLRLEATLPLYGQDLDETTTPLEAGLDWLVHLETKGDFMGRSVLESQKENGVNRKLVGLEMQVRHIARHSYPLLFEEKVIGTVTSGTISPTLEKAIALAYLPTPLTKIGQLLDVEIRGKTYPVKVVKKPFYRAPKNI